MSIGFDVLIVGGGHAGAHTAMALRQRGYTGSIAILSADSELPYERPPLSKDYLSGTRSFDRMLIRPKEFWVDRGVAIMTGTRVVAIDPARRRVTTQSGAMITYGDLVWAAGGEPRRLSCVGSDLECVHTIRLRADVDRLRRELMGSERAVIIGGGYIGLETAAVLSGLGKRVTMVEANPRLLSRVVGPAVSRFLECEHRARGIDILLSSSVSGIVDRGGRAAGVELENGNVLPADVVIVGIGIVPSVEPLRAAGAAIGNGVVVDALGRTSLPNVHAVGDCALQPHPFSEGRQVRIESVQNAVDMAGAVAAALCGDDAVKRTAPWFWSHQYDLRLQTIGLNDGHDEEIVHGDPARRRFSVAYLKRGQVTSVDCINDPQNFVEARALFSRNRSALNSRFGGTALAAAE